MDMETSGWQAVGIIWEEPKLYYNKTTKKVMARTMLGILPTKYDREKYSFIPVTAYGQLAHVLTHLCHKGSFVFMTGAMFTDTKLTSEQAKTLIRVTFRLRDVVVLKREDLKLDDIDFVGMSQLYDPEAFLEMEAEGYDPQ